MPPLAPQLRGVGIITLLACHSVFGHELSMPEARFAGIESEEMASPLAASPVCAVRRKPRAEFRIAFAGQPQASVAIPSFVRR